MKIRCLAHPLLFSLPLPRDIKTPHPFVAHMTQLAPPNPPPPHTLSRPVCPQCRRCRRRRRRQRPRCAHPTPRQNPTTPFRSRPNHHRRDIQVRLGQKTHTMNIFQFIRRPILFLRLMRFLKTRQNMRNNCCFLNPARFFVWNSHFPPDFVCVIICLLIPHSMLMFFSGARSGRAGRNHKAEWRHAADRSGGVCYQ